MQKNDIPEIFSSKHSLRSLTSQDFLNFGMRDLAYVRSVQEDGRSVYKIYAADGTQLSVMESMDMAADAVYHNDLELAALH